ncbi:MAG: hypothetical protein U1F49_04005 [Rubrivivax sp.]
MDDGVFCEFAVFAPGELAGVPLRLAAHSCGSATRSTHRWPRRVARLPLPT